MKLSDTKVALCLSLDELSNKTFEKVGNLLNFDEIKELHLINVFKEELFTNEFSVYTFPPESERKTIIKTTKEQLKTISKTIVGNSKVKKIVYTSEIHHDPKLFVTNYIQKNGIDLVVSATRGVSGFKGLFTSSFTDYLVKFSPCPVLVLRPQKNS